MTWRHQLQPASFRGVPFEMLSSALTAGRRLARHEYPQRDTPFLEDMGRRAREYKISAFIIGPYYMVGRDALLAAIEAPGAGQLHDRYRGTQLVTVTECEQTDSTEFGGMAQFELTFVEAGQQAHPIEGIDSGITLYGAQESAFGFIVEDFFRHFSIDGLPGWGIADIERTILSMLGLNDFFRLGSSLSRFRAKLGLTMRTPAILGNDVVSLMRLTLSVSSVLNSPHIVVNQRPAAPLLSSTRRQVLQAQSSVNMLFKRTALVQHVGVIANAEQLTSSDVAAARVSIIAAFDANNYAVGTPRPSVALSHRLKDVRTSALAHLSRQFAALPHTYQMQLTEPQPALVLAYALYGALRDNDIVRRNAVRHPGCLPAGQILELTVK